MEDTAQVLQPTWNLLSILLQVTGYETGFAGSLRRRLKLSASDLTETSGYSKPQLDFIQKVLFC